MLSRPKGQFSSSLSYFIFQVYNAYIPCYIVTKQHVFKVVEQITAWVLVYYFETHFETHLLLI